MTSASVRPPEPSTSLLGRIGWLLHDTRAVTRRNLIHFVRQRRLLVFSTVQPIMFVLLFSSVFGGVAGSALPEGTSYIDFLLPGLFVQSAAFRATQTTVGLAEDLERGVVDRFRSMPMSRSAVLAGRTTADLIRNVVIIWLMVGVGYLIGFRFSEGILAAIAAVAIVAFFGYTLNWIFSLVALLVPGAEAAQTAGFVVVFPLVFASSIFVPLETMPPWLAAIASVSPLSQAADASRALSIGFGDALAPVLATFAWCGVLLAVVVPVAVRIYRRMD